MADTAAEEIPDAIVRKATQAALATATGTWRLERTDATFEKCFQQVRAALNAALPDLLAAELERMTAAIHARTPNPEAAPAEPCPLTDNQLAALTVLAEGLTIPATARALAVSEGTLNSRLRVAYRLLGATNVTAAVATAIRHGWPPERQS